MFNSNNNDKRRYKILWDQIIGKYPQIQLKIGTVRKSFPLTMQNTKNRDTIYYVNNFVELKGKWDNSPEFGSLLTLKLKNITDSSIRIARLVFPVDNGLDKFLKGFKPLDISFLRNGYQSWSTARSYRLLEKPLRPWLQLVSLASSNMSNLPSNTPGDLSSEMFTLITDLATNNSFLVGQCPPFNQFFYIRLICHVSKKVMNYFELVYDFGRKMILPGETIQLDGIILSRDESADLLLKYFKYINNKMKIKTLDKNVKGWCTWYYYANKIKPDDIYKNLHFIKQNKIDLDYIQIDDGYQSFVGDWLNLNPQFKGRMSEIAGTIKEAGFIPGIWIAPFIADKKSNLVNLHPEYILRNEYGSPLLGGYNPNWPGKFYYGLDITNPRFEEYIRKVIRTIVHKWGFKYLKLDFMFGGSMRGGTHHNLRLSRAEVLKFGMKIIREEAKFDVIINGCGMPLSTGIGTVDIMRIGPDTGPFWKKLTGTFLRTGAMFGARNSIRNNFARSTMNRTLWINDPDCMMIRKKKTNLNPFQRISQINAIIISGGALFLSDNFLELNKEAISEIKKIIEFCRETFLGQTISLDLMNKSMAELIYNTRGYLGVFNFVNITRTKKINLKNYSILPKNINALEDIWTGEKMQIPGNKVVFFKSMPAFSSKLFRFIF